MPVNNDQIKVSDPWTIKSRNRGKRAEPSTQSPDKAGTRNEGAGTAAKTSVPERPIVDVVKRNPSTQNDKPFPQDRKSLSQKTGRGRNPARGGKEMGTFSPASNAAMSRNSANASRGDIGPDASGQISKGETKVRKYPAKGANARGANAG